ncbi:MAG: DUF1501 domain-containing protein [Phycisphaerae bacterium]|nr:DUF1501 domain-containing protein [Phycisphaerae bacterium]
MRVTRRYFLRSSGAMAAYLGVAPSLALPASVTSRAHPVTAGRTLVAIFLRGGADGLNLIVPFGDPNYAPLRKGIGISPPSSGGSLASAIDLDGYFGLHPRLSPLKPMFDAGRASALHAVGYDRNTRSHFEEQDVWETGVLGNTVHSDGWLNRHLATSEGHGPLRAVAVGDTLPRILHGAAAAYAVRGLEDLTLPGEASKREGLVRALEHAYCADRGAARDGARALLDRTAGSTLEGLRQLAAVLERTPMSAHRYPDTEIGRRLGQVARLIRADVGLEVAEIDYGGWDTHQQQGRVSDGGGTFGNLAGDLGEALAAFDADMGDRMNDVLVVTLSEFGRTAAENGSGGTDHGWASAMLLAGGAVSRVRAKGGDAGRPVQGTWPGLAPDQLHEGRDLLHTTDFRDVLAELVRVHLGNPNLERVLPERAFRPVGVIA